METGKGKGVGGGGRGLEYILCKVIVLSRTSTDWTKDHSVACGYCSEMGICDSYISVMSVLICVWISYFSERVVFLDTYQQSGHQYL